MRIGESERRAGTPLRRGSRGLVAVAVLAVLLVLASPGLAAARTYSQDTAPGGLIWRADNGDADLLSSFRRTDYNEKGGAPRDVASPSPEGGRALLFSLTPGGQRSELLPPIADQREGDVLYFGYRGKLGRDFPVGADKYQILMQWHQESDDGSPPVAVHVQRGQLLLAGGDDNRHESYEKPIASIAPGAYIDLIVRIAFSRDPSKGTVDVWSEGRRAVTAFRPPDGTMYDDHDYMKVGLYRDKDLKGTAEVTLDDLAVGGTRQAVDSALVGQGAPSAEGTPDAGPTDEDDGFGPVGGVGVVVALVALAVVGAGSAVYAARRRRERV